MPTISKASTYQEYEAVLGNHVYPVLVLSLLLRAAADDPEIDRS